MKTIGIILGLFISILWFAPLILAVTIQTKLVFTIASISMFVNFGVVAWLLGEKFYDWFKSNLKNE